MYRLVAFFFLLWLGHSVFAQDQLSQNHVEKLYQRGTELAAHSNYGAARQVFTEFLEHATPTDARRGEAEYYIAFSALTLRHEDGEKLIDDYIDHYPSSPKASTAYYDLANFFYSESNFVKAASYFRKVKFPALTSEQQSEGHFKWGYCYFNQKKLDDALEQFNFVKGLRNAYAPAANYYAGFIEYSKGNFDEALADLKRAESSPNYANIVPFIITNIYYKQGKHDMVISYAETLKDRRDLANSNEIAMLVAEAQFYQGDYKKALDAYGKYLDNTARADAGVLYRAGYAHYASGNTTKAIEYLEKAAASKDTVGYYASYYLGILYLKQGNKPYAVNAFNYARKNPTDKRLAEESSFQFAKVSYDAGKPDLAIDAFETFLTVYPNSAHTVEVKELLAQAYVNGNNFNKAIEYIEALPSRNQYINQAYQKAAYLKGAELFNKGTYAEAVEYFDRSLSYPVDKNYVALASFWSGEAYSIGRKYEEAAQKYFRVVNAGPGTDPDLILKARYGLGYAYFNQQAYDKALVSFAEFVNKGNKETPNYADGLIRLADCYYVNKRYSDALSNYRRAHTMGSPDNDYVLFQSGVIYGIQKNYSASRSQFTDLIRAYPRSQYREEAMFQQAQFEIEQGNYQAAVDGLTDLIRIGANSRFLPYAFMRRGASYFNLKQYDRTIADYTAVIQQFPGHPVAQDALLPLQEALNIAGRSGEFEKFLTLVKRANPDNKGLESLEYETAKNLYFDQQYQKAVVSLSGFVQEYPQSAKVPEARYYTAEAYYRLRDFDKALPIYRELTGDPTFTLANRTVGRIAEIEFKNGKYQDAVASFRAVERLAENKKDQYNAWSGLMESFYLLGQYDSADRYAHIILERGNVNAGAQNKASLYLGKSAMARGDFDAAKDEFLNTLNAARDENGAEAKYLLGLIFHEQKNYKQSNETLISLSNDFSSYESWVGKAFLLLADNFVAMGDVFQAKGTLQSLIDHFPQQGVKDEARRKLNQLELQSETKTSVARDSVQNEG